MFYKMKFFFILMTVLCSFSCSKNKHQRILELYKELTLNSSASVVMDKVKSSSLEFYKEKSWLYVTEKKEFFQGHWVLIACFYEGKLTGVYFGIGDDINYSPKGAPQKKGKCIK